MSAAVTPTNNNGSQFRSQFQRAQGRPGTSYSPPESDLRDLGPSLQRGLGGTAGHTMSNGEPGWGCLSGSSGAWGGRHLIELFSVLGG